MHSLGGQSGFLILREAPTRRLLMPRFFAAYDFRAFVQRAGRKICHGLAKAADAGGPARNRLLTLTQPLNLCFELKMRAQAEGAGPWASRPHFPPVPIHLNGLFLALRYMSCVFGAPTPAGCRRGLPRLQLVGQPQA